MGLPDGGICLTPTAIPRRNAADCNVNLQVLAEQRTNGRPPPESSVMALIRVLVVFSLFALLGSPRPASAAEGQGHEGAGTPTSKTELFSFEVHGNRMVGVLDTPASQPPVSTILIVHGYGKTNVVEGNRRTSLRQDVHDEMKRRGTRCECVRCREVCGKPVQLELLKLEDMVYRAGAAEEHFISYVTPDDKLAGFLRLSLPGGDSPRTGMSDLDGAALIREVHVYGQSLPVGAEKQGAAQHTGLGTRLLEEAESIVSRIDHHRRVLATHRQRALPYSDEQRGADRAACTAEIQELEELAERHSNLAALVDRSEGEVAQEYESLLADNEARTKELEQELLSKRTYEYEDINDQAKDAAEEAQQ